ncbi:MAG TPA: 30S ribosomal protein S9, partial [bacterium]|nr:30S ribosomal protein S9 [bacterium]
MAREAFMAVGKRKTSIARVRMTAGTGKVMVNDREVKDYFPRPAYVDMVMAPFVTTSTTDKFDVKANICGGELTGQAGALQQGIAKALLLVDP